MQEKLYLIVQERQEKILQISLNNIKWETLMKKIKFNNNKKPTKYIKKLHHTHIKRKIVFLIV